MALIGHVSKEDTGTSMTHAAPTEKYIHGVYAEYKVLTNIQYDKVEDMIPDSRRPNGRENDMYNERDNGPHISKQLSDHYGV